MSITDTPATVLVTGGSGAVGRLLVERLIGAGHHVVVTSRRQVDGSVAPGVTVVGGIDPVDPAALSPVLRANGVTHVVHLAARLRPGGGPDAVAADITANTAATAAVCAAAVGCRVRRVVVASTKAVYGHVDDRSGRPYAEDELALAPVDSYGLSKALGEQTARWFAARHDLEVVVARFGTTVGPGKGGQHGATALTSALIERPVAGLPVRIAHGGDAVDDFVYNGDVAAGLVALCLAPQLLGDTYHLSSGVAATISDLADAVRACVPGADIEIGPGDDLWGLGHNVHVVLDPSAARRDVGYRPRSPREWVPEYIDRFRRPERSLHGAPSDHH